VSSQCRDSRLRAPPARADHREDRRFLEVSVASVATALRITSSAGPDNSPLPIRRTGLLWSANTQSDHEFIEGLGAIGLIPGACRISTVLIPLVSSNGDWFDSRKVCSHDFSTKQAVASCRMLLNFEEVKSYKNDYSAQFLL
jgi:hypothetical protein